MSVSTLPEWKQLLLERKRREEEERERREREEEKRLASMPAWKRGIIQRRKAKQDEEREKEREKEGGHPPDVLGIIEDIVTEQMDSKPTVHLQTDPGSKAQNQLPKETIVPIRQNPFLQSENNWRRDNRGIRDGENRATTSTGKEGSRGKEREFWREQDREMWVERMENKSEGREKDRSIGREQVNKCREVESSTCHFSPVTGLRTIKVNNIIIIEKEKNSKESLEGREHAREEVQGEEKRMRMDLREFLAGGGSVTEIRASEVLIIKPPITDGKTGAEIAGVKERVHSREHLERERIWRKERESERDSACETSKTVTQRAERNTNHKDGGATECGGRVSQLLSKFGEHPKPPMRSKSTDCFDQLGKNRARYSTGDLFVQEAQWREEEDARPTIRGVPKRSFSFSDHVVCPQENGVCEEEFECKVLERTYSDRRVLPSMMVTGTDQSESEPRVTRRTGRRKHEEEVVMHEKRLKDRRAEKVRDPSVCRETEERILNADGEEGFTMASIKNLEGIAFARRVAIKQDGRETSSERENKRVREDNEREMKTDKEIQRDKRREGAIERETMKRQRQVEFRTEEKAESKRRWNQDEVNVVTALIQSHSTYIPPLYDSMDYNTAIDCSVDAQCQGVTSLSVDHTLQSYAFDAHRQPSAQMDLSQQTEDLHCSIGRVQTERQLNRAGQMCGDPDMISSEINQNTAHTIVAMSYHDRKEHQQYQNLSKQATEKSHFTSQISQQAATLNKPCTQEEVTIPRTVFYGVDVSAERRTSLPAGDGLGGGGVERRGSWKTGRPLTRVESLRERIRQQEEMQRVRQAEVMVGREEDRREAEGTVREVMQIQQEETTLQTLRLFDVTQEVTMAKSSPQLPVPVSLSHLQSVSTEREVGEIFRDVSESNRETEREPAHHVEDCGTRTIWRRQDIDGGEDEKERELLEEEYLPPSLSPSPPLSDSLDTMSRIYNLKAVGSRTAICISERKSDISTHNSKIQGTQGQYKPIRNVQSPDILPETAKLWNYGTTRDGDKTETVESKGVQMVQRQVELLQLRQQEAGCGSHNDREAQPSVQGSLLIEQEVKTAEGQKRPDILKETQKSQTPTSPRFPQAQQNVQRSHPNPQQARSFTINARNTQSTENSSKAPEQGNCPSSLSPCTPSPSTSPSPPRFSIRSASGGPGKRGTTITITPRRPAGVDSCGGTSTGTGPLGAPSRAVPQGQAPTTTTSGIKEAGKKRYPTAEEIEVIGGYQNLEKSCLVKNKGTPKAGKVCFNDTQLERVCEYPSEDIVLESLPCSHHLGPEDGRDEGRSGEEQEEEEEEEKGELVSRSDMSVSTGRVRFLKVDESCKR